MLLIIIVIVQKRGIMHDLNQEVVISIVGDIMLDRGVDSSMQRNNIAYPYEEVTKIFLEDDITIANLECPLLLTAKEGVPNKEFIFKADLNNAKALKEAGFDAMILANNHTMDYLSAGLEDTMDALSNVEILFAGAGEGKNKIKPCFIKKKGIKVGIMSYNTFLPENYGEEDSATIAYASTDFLDEMQAEIKGALVQCDFLIVYFHWGIEYRHYVDDSQIELAHAAIDAGASAVVGTHPHVLQGKEKYKEAPIYYSLGNFIFDQQIIEKTDEAIILQLTINKEGIASMNEIPIVIKSCQPQLADDSKAEEIKADLMKYSSWLK